MKNSMWVAVSIPLLTLLASAESKGEISQIDHEEYRSNLNSSYTIEVLQDGSAIITRNDGKTFSLTKELVQVFKAINLNDPITFRGGRPCALIAT